MTEFFYNRLTFNNAIEDCKQITNQVHVYLHFPDSLVASILRVEQLIQACFIYNFDSTQTN